MRYMDTAEIVEEFMYEVGTRADSLGYDV